MTLHKLSAGDGYTYLTRQVAAHDTTERAQAGLSKYYAQQGETPGRWLGSGLTNLGLGAGEHVTEEQMVALFGHGHHPRESELGRSAPLGRGFPSYDAATLRREVSKAFSAYNRERGMDWNQPIAANVRARIRSELASKRFIERHGRDPVDARELAGFVAAESRPKAAPVAGFDLTFSPVKSVSALWALAPREVADQVVAAHDAAVADVLAWLEREVAFTRTGRAGVRQVPVVGLVAAAFTHRDSRAGDPDLHTHVAVSNKVQATAEHGGAWLALDGRVLYKAKVAACERYNTRLEAGLSERLGVRFVDRPGDADKRPVREIEGVDRLLLFEWSKRRHSITLQQTRLAARFQVQHGRPPTSIELQALAQQANLQTRQAKHQPRSEAEQRLAWRREAQQLGLDPDALVAQAVNRGGRVTPLDERQLRSVAVTSVAVLEASRATWQIWHVRAEAERQARSARVPLGQLDDAVNQVVTYVLDHLSVRLDDPDGVREPAALKRPDGASLYDVHGSTRYTSQRVLQAEQTVLAAARRTDGRRVDPTRLGIVLAEAASNRRGLDASQSSLVTTLATSGARMQVALAPAGTGKTATMRVLAAAWRDTGGNVLGLAPSAVAARELGIALRGHSDTLSKLTTDLTTRLTTGSLPAWLEAVGPETLIVVDEAGMAATSDLATLVTFALDRGASVRLVGDDQQLASVAAGGVLRDLVRQAPAASLSVVHRFSDPGEAAASLALRDGEPAGLGYYTDHQRIHVGDPGSAADQAYEAWRADRSVGLDSLLLAPTRTAAADLNRRARADRLAGDSPRRAVDLVDGTQASEGDHVVTRRNDRRLPICDTDWVKNGDRWQVTRVRRDGSLSVTRAGSHHQVLLPASYVAEHVQLAYAATIHTAQGMTVDTSHTVISGSETRQLLYVALSRGRLENHVYLSDAVAPLDDAGLPRPEHPQPLDTLRALLKHDGAQTSASTVHAEATDPSLGLRQAVLRYSDALTVAAQRSLKVLDEEPAGHGPLPWLSGIPGALREHPAWGEYLRERYELVVSIAQEVAFADHSSKSWSKDLSPPLVRDLAVWRAAYGVELDDRRPTGPTLDGQGRGHQRLLDRAVLDHRPRGAAPNWLLPADVSADPRAPHLRQQLAELRLRRRDVPELIRKALEVPRPLPVENPADALWWRIVAANATTPPPKPARESTNRASASTALRPHSYTTPPHRPTPPRDRSGLSR